MARLAINPTRMELLRLRRRLTVARRGHKLLKDKLDGLMKEFMQVAVEYKRMRNAVDEEMPGVLKLFVLAEATSSRAITEDALENARSEMTVTRSSRRIMSVVVPKLDVVFGETLGGYSMVQTSPELDAAIAGLRGFMPKLLRLAELEQTVRLLSSEIEKTRRRVNALEHTFIPRMQETVKYITSKLDEAERSNTSRLMKIKAQRLAEEAG
jgi:V/A-type H+-transporting ATPase subunit D